MGKRFPIQLTSPKKLPTVLIVIGKNTLYKMLCSNGHDKWAALTHMAQTIVQHKDLHTLHKMLCSKPPRII